MILSIYFGLTKYYLVDISNKNKFKCLIRSFLISCITVDHLPFDQRVFSLLLRLIYHSWHLSKQTYREFFYLKEQ